MTYNINGKLKLTIVSGAAITGLYAADGSFNAVSTSENTTLKGYQHPCGAVWTTTTSGPTNHQAKDGSRHCVSDGSGGFVLAFP